MARWIKGIIKGGRWRELVTHLGWMVVVALLIYAVQHLPIGVAWKIAIGEGIGIFGGVELILDVIRGHRMEREIEELRLEREAERRENEELRRRNAELEAIIRAAQERENEELRRRVAELEAKVNNPKDLGTSES